MEQQNQQSLSQKQTNISSIRKYLAGPRLPLVIALVVILTVGGILLLKEVQKEKPEITITKPFTACVSDDECMIVPSYYCCIEAWAINRSYEEAYSNNPETIKDPDLCAVIECGDADLSSYTAQCVSNKCVPVRKETKALDTSDWQTYRSDEFGFEVKYPKDTFIPVESSVLPTQFNGVNTPYATVSFVYDKVISDYAMIVAEFRIISAAVPYEVRWNGKEVPTEGVNVWSIKIEGVPVAVRQGRVNNQDLTTYSFVSKGNYYELRLALYDLDEDKILHKKVFDQILSTFRFTPTP